MQLSVPVKKLTPLIPANKIIIKIHPINNPAARFSKVDFPYTSMMIWSFAVLRNAAKISIYMSSVSWYIAWLV
jgi:hypothetical protein